MFERFPSLRQALLLTMATAISATAPAGEGKAAAMENLTTTPPKAVTSVITVPAPSEAPRVVYGSDDRRDIYAESDPAILGLAKSVGAVVFASDLTDNGDGTYSIATETYGTKYDLCPTEPFYNQPVAPGCSGFVVGEDLIATAGRCILLDGETADPDGEAKPSLADFRLVFGFEMLDATTPVLTIPASNVFSAVELVARERNFSGADYAIIRVDRAIVTPERKALAIRRSGIVDDLEPVGVIGHPSGLPLKVDFGGRSRVRGNSSEFYFEANLDASGRSYGSPVINQETLLVEGILARTEVAFYTTGDCRVTSVLPDGSGREDVTRISPLQGSIPAFSEVHFQKRYFNCSALAEIHVHDPNWPDEDLTVTVTGAWGGDSEQVTLSDPSVLLDWVGHVQLAPTDNDVATNDGVLEIEDEEAIIVTYDDGDTGEGGSESYSDQAIIDCVAPLIDGVVLTDLGPSYFELTFGTNEPASAVLSGGATCGASGQLASSELGTFHEARGQGLQSCQSYLVTITATDRAGNTSIANDNGNCIRVRPYGSQADILFEDFDPSGGVVGWTSLPLNPAPPALAVNNWNLRSSVFAESGGFVYSHEPGYGVVMDASLISPAFGPANILEFHHTYSTEESFDGCVVELSTDDGQTWQDLGPYIAEGGYNARISERYNSPIGGRLAWSGGAYGPMTKVIVNLSTLAGAQNQVRFRYASDSSGESDGWQVDDVRIYETYACPEGNQWILY